MPPPDGTPGTAPARALIAGIVHESSTFTTELLGPTGLADFEVHEGTDVLREFGGTNTIVGGYLDVCAREGVVPAPALHARAEPGAAVAGAALTELRDRLRTAAASAGPFDVVLLDLHGAGATESGDALDLAVARDVRALAGPGVPIAATLDLHANVPHGLADCVDVLVGFHEYPHVDMAARASRAAGLAIAAARGRTRPVSVLVRLPMLIPPSPTDHGPAAEARDLAAAAETEPGVLACTVLHGFPYADTAHAAVSVATVVDAGDRDLGRAACERIGTRLWQRRERFLAAPLTPRETVRRARAQGTKPVVIGDRTDNPGVGAAGDATHLLKAVLEHPDLPACVAAVHDPRTVAQAVAAGVGARITVSLGGHHGRAGGPPVHADAVVRAITDGRVVQRVMRRGKALDFGPSVRLSIGLTDVIVSSLRRQVLDPEIMILHGAPPERYDVVVVKSGNHFRAGFGDVAAATLVADAPGPHSRDIEGFPRAGPSGNLWPINRDARFVPYRPPAPPDAPPPRRTTGHTP